MEAELWFGIYMGMLGLVAGIFIGAIGQGYRVYNAFHRGKAEGWYEACEMITPPVEARTLYQQTLSNLRTAK